MPSDSLFYGSNYEISTQERIGWSTLSGSDPNRRTSAVVADNENRGDIADNAKQIMIREVL
jgi:hypothetical protein